MLDVTPGINMTVQEGDSPSLATDENIELSMSVSGAGSGGGLVNSVDGKIGDVEVLPTGGTTGQVLKKASEADYDVEWADESGGGGAVTSVNGKTGVVVLDADDVGAGTYSKPTGGIPASDMASAVQTSLGKADTALQTAPVSSVNSRTGAVTGLQETSNLVTSLTSSSTDAQYPSAKCVYDLIGDIETLLAAI